MISPDLGIFRQIFIQLERPTYLLVSCPVHNENIPFIHRFLPILGIYHSRGSEVTKTRKYPLSVSTPRLQA